MYQIDFHPKADRFFRKLTRVEQIGLSEKIDILRKNPLDLGLDVKKMVNYHGCFRLRYRKIRVIYQIDSEEQKILVINIDFRGNIY